MKGGYLVKQCDYCGQDLKDLNNNLHKKCGETFENKCYNEIVKNNNNHPEIIVFRNGHPTRVRVCLKCHKVLPLEYSKEYCERCIRIHLLKKEHPETVYKGKRSDKSGKEKGN